MHPLIALLQKPPLQHLQNVIYFFIGKRPATWNAVPLCKTRSATRGGGVLGNEHRMSSKRCLLAIVTWFGWGKPLRDKVAGVLKHDRQGLLPKISKFRRPQM